MDPAMLADFEATCEAALGNASVTPAERAAAESKLAILATSTEHIPTIQAVLDATTSDVAVVGAARSLMMLITDHWNSFEPSERVQIRE